jgi:hypothetical protein
MKTLSSSAMLLDLSISTYTGRKQDKATAAEVNLAKNTRSKNAASVYKSLFTEDKDLEAIIAHAAKVRAWLYSQTLPWTDSGTRLVPTKNFFEVSHELTVQAKEFYILVQTFLNNYSTKVSAQAFKLGKLFDSIEYPTAEQVELKFGFRYHFMPVPEVGDFRVNIPAEAVEELKAEFEIASQARLRAAMEAPWQRLYEEVTHIKNKMINKEDGKPQKLYQSMLDNALALCDTLDALNVMDDPDLDEARRALKTALSTTDIDSLRESPEMRQSVMQEMENLVSKFSI